MDERVHKEGEIMIAKCILAKGQTVRIDDLLTTTDSSEAESEMKRIYRTEFSAGHYIEGHPRCGEQHGHNYQLVVQFQYDPWIDFHDFSDAVDEALEKFDHHNLGHMTCEKLAKDIRAAIWNEFRKRDIIVKARQISVELWETSEFGVIV